MVIALKESTFVSHVKTVRAMGGETHVLLAAKRAQRRRCSDTTFGFQNCTFLTAALATTYELHCLLGIVLVAIRDEGVASVLAREGVHH